MIPYYLFKVFELTPSDPKAATLKDQSPIEQQVESRYSRFHSKKDDDSDIPKNDFEIAKRLKTPLAKTKGALLDKSNSHF